MNSNSNIHASTNESLLCNCILDMQQNIFNEKLKLCSAKPLTGFERTGYCRTNANDQGNHLVCAEMSDEFLEFTKEKGNNLYSVVKPGDRWCLCQKRYLESFNANKHPVVIPEATNYKIQANVKKAIKKTLKGGRKKVVLPKLRPISYKNKKHRYKLKDDYSTRKKAIDEGVYMESKKTGYTLKKAATAKKRRFNVLRIYRRKNKVKECNKITKDMKYIDKKYKLGKTKNICGKKK